MEDRLFYNKTNLILKILILILFINFINSDYIKRNKRLTKVLSNNNNNNEIFNNFDCRQSGKECLHDGICSTDGLKCDCSPSPNWFGKQCELRRCVQLYNPCDNGAACEKTEQSFKCHCPPGFDGIYCDKQLETVCSNSNLNPCGEHGNCILGNNINEYKCECNYGWTGSHCSEINHCQLEDYFCLNGNCINNLNKNINKDGNLITHFCECRNGWGGTHCDLDIDECQSGTEICQNGGKCVNLIGSFYCECPPTFVGQFCERPNILDQCQPSPCLNNGTCHLSMTATTSSWALDAEKFNWHWECNCPDGFEGERCEKIVDNCLTGRTICVNGGQCVHPWIEVFDNNGNDTKSIQQKWHPSECKCMSGFTGEFCERDVNECEVHSGLCQNGATCMNRHGTYLCLCVGGFEGKHCENNLDDCIDNLCYAGSTCVDGISRYTCLCAPDRVGNLCEFPNPCFNTSNNNNGPCLHGKCYPDFEFGNHSCHCDDGWMGKNCDKVDCLNGGKKEGDNECECLPPFTGSLCEIEKPDPCSQNICAAGSVCAPNVDYISYSCQCPAHLTGQFCERQLPPCEDGYNPCGIRGICHKNNDDNEHFTCECLNGWTGPLCDKQIDYENILPNERQRCIGCKNGGTCSKNNGGGGGDLWTCLCPPGFQGSQCESEKNLCLNVTCKHKGKCVNLGGVDFRCDCSPGWKGTVCETNINDCENIVCLNGGVCIDRLNNYHCDCARGFVGRHCEIFVPVDKFNRTDMVDMDNCRRQGCEKKASNGKCDPECNFYSCHFDGGECSTHQINPFERCPQPSYCSHSFSNGKCDEVCNNERCLFDGFDCLPRPLAKCPRLAECALRYANGQCDQQCNMAACGWDGGDCDHDVEPESHVLLGELVLVLAVQPEELFPNLLRQFLLSLSSHLRVSLSLSIDEEGKPNLFHWSRDSGIGKRIDLPPGMNVTTMFSVHYYETENVGEEKKNKNEIVQERRKRDLNDISKKEGVALFLRVDVTMCNLLDSSSSSTSLPRIIHHQIQEHAEHPHRHHHHIYHSNNKLLGVHEPCFSHMDSVAAYALQDIGVPILQSEARLSPHSSSKSIGFFWYVLVTLMFSLVIGSVIIIRRPRNNKMKSAKTWRPPIVEQQNSKYGSSSTLASHQQLHQQQQALRAPTIWPHYPVASSSSCASSNMPLMINHAVSMNSLSNQSNIYSQHTQHQYQNSANSMIQLTNNHQHLQQQQNKLYRQHPYLQQHLLQQSSTLPRNGNCWTTATTTLIGENNKNISQQYLISSSQQQQLLIGATGNINGIATLPIPNNTTNIYNNHNQHISLGNGEINHFPSVQTTTTTSIANNNSSTSYSRCSSSGIGGSSTEHSPLGQLLPLHCSTIVEPSLICNNENEEQKQRRRHIKELRDFVMFKRRGLLDVNSEIISKLEPCIVNSTNERGRTFLHLLFQNMLLMTSNDNETDLLANIDLLFKFGVSIDAKDDDGTTSLSLAVRNRKLRAVRKLIIECNADANLPDIDNKSPLYHICANLSTEEDLKIAEFLINEVVDLKLDTLARETETPLIRCAALCNPFSLRIAELLISRVEVSQRIEFINFSGKTLCTALHRAASVGNEPMVRLLIKHGANKEVPDKEGKTPLFVAVEQAQYETVSVLLEMGADRNKSDMNDTKIMELSSQRGFEPISQLFRKFPENQTNYQHLPSSFNSSTRSSSTPKIISNNSQQQKTSTNQNNGKRQRAGTKRRNTTLNNVTTTTTNNSSILQRDVNSVLLPHSSSTNNGGVNNIYEDGSSAAKKRAAIIPLKTNISPPCYSSNNISQQSLNNSNLLQNQQIPSSPVILPSIQQNQFNEEDNNLEVSNIRTSFFPITTNNNSTIMNNYNNNNEGMSTTTTNFGPLCSRQTLESFMHAYLR